VRIEFTYARGPDHFAGHPSLGVRHRSAVPSYVIAAVIVVAGAALAVAALVAHAGQAASCGGLAILLGGSIAVAARQRRFTMTPAVMEPRRWVVSDEGVEISHPGSSSTATWAAFRYGWELPHAYLFVMKDQGDRRTFDIPREPLTPADDEALRATAARHGIAFYGRPKVG
jgi:hypothetical protein